MKQQDTYEAPKIITFSNMVVSVYTPILTREERERRMKRIGEAAENLLKEARRPKPDTART